MTSPRSAGDDWVRIGPHTLGRSPEPVERPFAAPAAVDRRRLGLTLILASPLIVAIVAAALT